MAEWSYADEVFGLIPVQEGGAGARRQPGPGVQPMPDMARARPRARSQVAAPQPMPQAQTAPEPAKPYSYADEILTPVAPSARAAPADPLAEPDAPTWWGRRLQDVRGKQDPRYKNLPALVDTGAVNLGDDSVAKLTMPNDEAYGDILTKSFADGVTMTRRFKDANGYEIVGFSGPDGKEQLAYVNQPGLDTNDIARGFVGSLPFMAGGGVAGRALQKAGAPLLARVGGQAATGAAVSGAQDIAASQMGSEQGIDLPKMIGGTAGGAIGEGLAPAVGGLWRKFVVEPSLYNRATGTLTPKGIDAAKAAGLDPLEMTAEIQREFAKQMARAGDARAAGVAAETGDLNIPTTLGQRTKDVAQLTREQEMRDGVWGQAAADQMKAFDKAQWEAMVKATMGQIEPGKPGVSLTINPGRSPGEYTPGQIGAAIGERIGVARDAMRKAETEAWKRVGDIEATDAALAEVPRFINQSLGGMRINASSHPIASAMIDDLTAFMGGKAPKQVAPWLTGNPSRDVNEFRKMIGKSMSGMERGPDKKAAGAIYDGLNNWIREMADQKLLTATNADAATAAAHMVTARGITRNLHEVIDIPGKPAAARIVKQILDVADSPEQVVRELFVGPTAKSVKPGSIEALKSIKQMASNLPKEEGDQLISDLKLAYWLQIVRNPAGKEGENIFNPQVLLRNLRVSSDSQRSVWHALFTPQEIAMRNRLIRALENGPTFHDWTIKPNSSRSGTTVGRMFMDVLGSLVGSNYAKTGMEVANRMTGRSRAAVYGATRQDLPAVNPRRIAPYFEAGGAAGAQSQE